MTEVSIGSYERDDLDGVIDMITSIQMGEFGRDDPLNERMDLYAIADTYQVGGGGFWVAKVGRQVVGTVGLKTFSATGAVVKRMYVAAPWRGEAGVAGRLLDAIVDHARACRMTDLYLGTIDILVAAQRFYAKNGFSAIKRGDLPPDASISSDDTDFYHRALG